KEEKRRGITINLGFTHLLLPSGNTLGVVDVPGHKNFVHTMVAGASGIDIACLVVAADEGVMPQTREHVEIMSILGMKNGVVALTKADLVDADVLGMARDEVRELLEGTFLYKAPVVPVSAKTGEGMEDLRAALDDCVDYTTERPRGEVFRMFIDRVFTVAGFGTVVTGSVIGGMVKTGDTVYLLPPEKDLRVRRLEHHGQEVAELSAGDRASMNLVGLNRGDFERGMVVSDRRLRATTLVDAHLRLFDHARSLGLWSHGIFLMGTYEAQARIHSMDKDGIQGGDTAIVQVHLPEPCVAMAGDRFVLRGTSSDITLGGGEIIDPAPLHHRRRPPGLIRRLQRIAEGKLPELVAAEVRKGIRPVSERTLATEVNVSLRELASIIDTDMPDDILVMRAERERYLTTTTSCNRLSEAAIKAIAAHHRRNPLNEDGATTEELLGKVGMAASPEGHEALNTILMRLEQAGKIKRVRHTWASAEHRVTISPELKRRIEAVEGYLKGCGMQTPLTAELERIARKNGTDDREMRRILRHLVGTRTVYDIDGVYLHATVVDVVRKKLLGALMKRPRGLTVAEFRDLIGGNRKICLLLYTLFDREGITERRGDVRIPTDKGKRQAVELLGEHQ
ncbi:MAG: selenocysteine-specific translation elongation factor, partial [Chitinivibrionales bacterium]|nr:selenocysteine-specific translation elongation factor [Chitinivibrionales bacterium]MBD3358598.1 selenocysteine-specific translation elongation factor [Chitinivibrionales bacterium]